MGKGQREFSKATADRIRVLLGQTRNSDRPQQIALRGKIRDLGFYISDFNRPAEGFGPEDFDELVRGGQIRVIG